jgi:hypothetical protein
MRSYCGNGCYCLVDVVVPINIVGRGFDAHHVVVADIMFGKAIFFREGNEAASLRQHRRSSGVI